MTTLTLPNFGKRINARRRPPSDYEIVLDGFAGFGGWGLGEEEANGYAIDIAFNHDAGACASYAINHPGTHVLHSDAFEVHPQSIEPGRPMAHGHFSPDCTHHSKARGAAPVSDRVRGLAWIVLAWMYLRRPRVITMENVEEFQKWGRTMRAPGGRKADPEHAGETFAFFTACLRDGVRPNQPGRAYSLREMREAIGFMVGENGITEIMRGLRYRAEWKELRACDYGAPTIRKRFYLIARCDDEAIVWPEPTHGEGRAGGPHPPMHPWLDLSLDCPSIFLTKAEARQYYERTGKRIIRPLKPKTLHRICNGVHRFVLKEDANPFVIPLTHGGGLERAHDVNEPSPTITGANRGELAVVSPVLSSYHSSKCQEDRCHRVDQPLPTLDQSNRYALAAAFLAKHNGGTTGQSLRDPCHTLAGNINKAIVTAELIAPHLSMHRGGKVGLDVRQPAPTITAGSYKKRPAGAGHALGLTAAHLMKLRGTCAHGQSVEDPAPTLTGGGQHAALVATFLQTYYSSGSGKTLRPTNLPCPTIPSADVMGLVTVLIAGEPYVVVDIGMRMLEPYELLGCQFGELSEGWVLTGSKTEQVAGIGNSVCPHVARAIVLANVRIRRTRRERAA